MESHLKHRIRRVLGEDADLAMTITNLKSANSAIEKFNLTVEQVTATIERIRHKLEALKERNLDATQ